MKPAYGQTEQLPNQLRLVKIFRQVIPTTANTVVQTKQVFILDMIPDNIRSANSASTGAQNAAQTITSTQTFQASNYPYGRK